MASLITVSSIAIEDFVFPPSVRPPATEKSFFLGGAGVRGLTIQGTFISFTAIGIYFEETAVASLADKWKGKSATELAESVEFFRDVVTGQFEKFIQISMLKPLTGAQYSEKVSENCVAIWKAIGIYSEADEKAIEKFTEIFKEQNFPPGTSILFKQCAPKSLRIAFGKHDAIPEADVAVIENGPLSQSVLESIIGKNGVSPAARESLAVRLHELLNPTKVANGEAEIKVANGEAKAETKVANGKAETKENGVEIKE
uniref:Chalcone-flavonone isomerase family protein n=1 Tax=Fagopyrum esculentum TaxID=3617 RepID=R4H4Z4_FAGES|nr:chalcone isomerase [Fagopyrum esculentum]